MHAIPEILERLYGVPRQTRRQRLAKRLRELRRSVGRWARVQQWGLALGASAIVLIFLGHGYYYNRLYALENNVNTAWARVEAGQQRRNHIARNLSQLAYFYASYEQGQMLDLTKQRTESEQSADADSDTAGLLGRLNAVAEQYPNLQLTNSVQQLATGMINTESQIAGYIISYNEAVNIYVTARHSFPARIFSIALGFKDRAFYQPEDPDVLRFQELKLNDP